MIGLSAPSSLYSDPVAARMTARGDQDRARFQHADGGFDVYIEHHSHIAIVRMNSITCEMKDPVELPAADCPLDHVGIQSVDLEQFADPGRMFARAL